MIDLENAKLFEREAISTYEKKLARDLVEALEKIEILREALDECLYYFRDGKHPNYKKLCQDALNYNEYSEKAEK